MTIDEFRTKSAQGGFDTSSLSDAEVFLSPKSFQAVGKVEGWKVSNFDCTNFEPQEHHDYGNCDSCVAGQAHWLNNMHRMINALADGKTIEEYLSTL